LERSRLARNHLQEELKICSKRILEYEHPQEEPMYVTNFDQQTNKNLKDEIASLQEQSLKIKRDGEIRILQLEDDRTNLRASVGVTKI
jgi:hypothetical protein